MAKRIEKTFKVFIGEVDIGEETISELKDRLVVIAPTETQGNE